MKSKDAEEIDGSAALRQLGALIQAGLSPASARRLVEAQIAALPASDLALVDYVWAVSTKSGGSMATVIERLAQVMQARREAWREAQLAYASPRATARLVLSLPFISILLAELLGIHALAAIFASIIAAVSVALGLLLLLIGKFWSDRMLRKSLPVVADDAILLDAFAIALQAGLSPPRAGAIAFDDFEFANSLNKQLMLEEIAKAGSVAISTGASMSELVKAAADEVRKLQSFSRANSLAKLSVKLMIPLGVAVLPAFVLLTIIPIAVSLLISSNIK